MKNIISVFILLFGFLSFSQNYIYIDQNLNEIDSVVFKKKCKKSIFKCFDVSFNDTIVKKVYNKYQFGTLSKDENLELRKSFRGEILQTKNIVINYSDSLFDFSSCKAKHIDFTAKHNENRKSFTINGITKKVPILNVLSNKELIIRRKKLILKRNKCIAKFSKNNTIVKYYYGSGNNNFHPNFNWIKDKNKFIKKNIF